MVLLQGGLETFQQTKMQASRRTKNRRIGQAVQKTLSQIRNPTLQPMKTPTLPDTRLQERVQLQPFSYEFDRSLDTDSYINEVQDNLNDASVDKINQLNRIKLWAISHNITHVALNDLLRVLKIMLPEQYFPKDSRTLLKTPRQLEFTNIEGGQIYYFGIRSHILRCIDKGLEVFKLPNLGHLLCLTNLITVTVGIDGLPLSKSSKKQFWPILGYVDQTKDKAVFPIGIYFGEEVKPQNISQFLEQFIIEVNELEKGFLYNGISYNFRIRCIIADAPARSFIKCVNSHNAYYGCERCFRRGKHKNGRLLYSYWPEEELQCDLTFRDRIHNKHHNQEVISPLISLEFGMISQIPIDYMHLCCLGVMKKLLLLWKEGPLPHKVRPKICKKISKRLDMLKSFIPSEFVRKTRSLDIIRNWKATEFRTFMLYVGPVVLHDLIDKPRFEHFILFHSAMYVLVSQAAYKSDWISCASNMINKFTRDFAQLYSKDCMIYNVHMLNHLYLDSVVHGPLDRISAFPFENHMQQLKRKLRKNNNYLSQIVKRLKEAENMPNQTVMKSDLLIRVRNNERDNCYLMTNFKICMLRSVSGENCFVQLFVEQSDVPYYPISSSKLGIFFVEGDGITLEAKTCDLFKKCIKLPHKTGYICIPLCDF